MLLKKSPNRNVYLIHLGRDATDEDIVNTEELYNDEYTNHYLWMLAEKAMFEAEVEEVKPSKKK